MEWKEKRSPSRPFAAAAMAMVELGQPTERCQKQNPQIQQKKSASHHCWVLSRGLHSPLTFTSFINSSFHHQRHDNTVQRTYSQQLNCHREALATWVPFVSFFTRWRRRTMQAWREIGNFITRIVQEFSLDRVLQCAVVTVAPVLEQCSAMQCSAPGSSHCLVMHMYWWHRLYMFVITATLVVCHQA